MKMPKAKKIDNGKIFLARLADLLDQFNAELSYTTDDDGINITVDGEFVFAGFIEDTRKLREKIESL